MRSSQTEMIKMSKAVIRNINLICSRRDGGGFYLFFFLLRPLVAATVSLRGSLISPAHSLSAPALWAVTAKIDGSRRRRPPRRRSDQLQSVAMIVTLLAGLWAAPAASGRG